MATLGFEQANVFLFGTRSVTIARLWAQGGLVALIVGTLGAFLMAAAPSLMPGTFGSSPPLLWVIAALGLPITLHAQFAAGLLTLRGQVTWQFRAALVSGALQAAALFGLFLTDAFSPAAVLAISVASSVVTWALTVGRMRGEGLWIRWDGQLLKD